MPLSYQWQKNGANISGATAATYITPVTTSADNGSTFDVVVSNSGGSVTSSSVTLTVNSSSGSNPPSGSNNTSGTDVTTYHNDVARTGQNLTETVLTQANVNSQTFGLLRNLMVDGKVDAEPLYLSQFTVAGSAHNVVFIATEHDSVYAFDADTGSQLWKVSLLGAGETTSDDHGCGQVVPEIGITATPVIDRNAGPHGTIYVAAMSKNGSGNYFQRIHALDLTTGAEQNSSPVTVQASYAGTGSNSVNGQITFDAGQYEERAALLLLNGVVYTSWTSHCDMTPYSAWIIGYKESTLAQASVLNLTPGGTGSIWQSGGGLAADAQGNIYAMIANGTFEATLDSNGFPSGGDYGNAFVKVSTSGGTLQVADYFDMQNTISESGSDTDFGSGGPMLLPDISNGSGGTVQLAVGAGKDGNIYVVDRNNMGKFNPSANNIYQGLFNVVPNGVFGVPAYSNGVVYYCDINGTLKAFAISNGQLATSGPHTGTTFTFPGALPSISANGTSNGIVWAIENTSPAVLHAYVANDLTHELYNSNQAANGRDNFGAGNKFITPMIADGKVFAATQNSVGVFGLLP